MKTYTDFNGHTNVYDYDTFGRLTSIIKPPDTAHTVEFDYVLSYSMGDEKVINWVETRQKDDTGNLVSRTFYDGLNRAVMTRQEGETSEQVIVKDAVKFNAKGAVWKGYLPYFSSGLDYQKPLAETGFQEYIYHASGREIRLKQPGGAEYSEKIHKPFIKEEKDEEQTKPGGTHSGCFKRYIEDGLLDDDSKGRLRIVEEIVRISDKGEPTGNTATWTTTYSYDLNGSLTGYTDSQGNKKTILYDALKRKTFMSDPDMGYMWYAYDDAGNLIRTRDANGHETAYTYDGVNRLTGEFYLTDDEERLST